MNNFFKTFLASLLAIIVSVGAIFIFSFMFFAILIGSATTGDTTKVNIKPNTILEIDFSIPINESVSENPVEYFDIYSMQFRQNISSYDIVKSINIAKNDINISAIYLNMTNQPMVDIANLEDIRNALIEFKAKGKKIYSYADVYSQRSYYLSSIADSIYLCPVGDLQWIGISSTNMFYKGALDKLGVNVEIFKYGKYKSAVEPFMLTKMSIESRQQSERMINNLWSVIVNNISESRNIPAEKLNEYASTLAIVEPKDALKLGFVDKLAYKSDIKIDGNIVSFTKYLETNKYNELIMGSGSNKNQIAVIYADGEIISGKAVQGTIGDVSLVKKIAAAAKNDNVKAIVLRVNSPGGSALASDIIDREIRNAKVKKPIIVSMGSYAASGGYYISANADAIVASPFTLTGSIGVFGMSFNIGETITENFGVTFDVVKTSNYADIGSQFRAMTDMEKRHFQKRVDQVYETFVNCVSDGRDMSFNKVDSIAQGRVWTTEDAISIGLVDYQGGLMDAVMLAAEKADISDNYVVKAGIPANDFMSNFINMLNKESISILMNKIKENKMGALSQINNELKRLELLMKGDKIQAIIPFYINL